MRRNLFVVVLIPCILACILLILIITDNRYTAKKAANSGAESIEKIGVIHTTESETSIPTAIANPTTLPIQPTTIASATTSVPTQTEMPIPTSKSTQVSTPDKIREETTESSKILETNEKETDAPSKNDTYAGLYIQKGNDYTLIADKNTKHFLFVNPHDNKIRRTEFVYHPKYEQLTDDHFGPILGYKNQQFIFIAQNQIVASDGVSETILVTFKNAKFSGDININLLLQSENRILVDIEGVLNVIDFRTLSIKTYKEDYSSGFFVFTDDYLCFSSRRHITASSYYNYLYTIKDDKAILLGSIGEIDEYTLDNDVVYIQSQDQLFQISLSTGELLSSSQIDRERKLYFPVYGSSIIQGLSEIRYINYNNEDKPVQSIKVPDFLKVECCYGAPYAISQFLLYMKNDGQSEQLPEGPFGSFSAIDYTVYPLDSNKYLMHSTVKEKLYSGTTCMGEGEIFLLERIEIKNNNSVPFEMIYAWVPIKNELRAYQFYIYVPAEDDQAVWLKMVKQLLEAN